MIGTLWLAMCVGKNHTNLMFLKLEVKGKKVIVSYSIETQNLYKLNFILLTNAKKEEN